MYENDLCKLSDIFVYLLILIFGLKLLFKTCAKKEKGIKNKNYEMIETHKDLKKFSDLILSQNIKLIGLDSEYYRGQEYHGRLCTLQISFRMQEKSHVYIIDLLKFTKEEVHSCLNCILSDDQIEKVIHSCENDLEWIYDEYKITVKNVFDTQEAHKLLTKSRVSVGLNFLLNKYFETNLDDKTKKHFQTSDWQKRPLNQDQLDYAAMDAYYLPDLRNVLKSEIEKKRLTSNPYEMGTKIISRLNNDKKERNEQKALNYLLSNITKCEEGNLEGIKSLYLQIYRLVDETAFNNNFNLESILNKKLIFKIATRLPNNHSELILLIKKENPSLNLEKWSFILEKITIIISENKNSTNFINIDQKIIISNPNQKQSKVEKREKIIKKFSCKKPVYENYHMYAPDGDLLCYCDKKKMTWYLERGLGVMIKEDPPSFKLTFEPNSRGCIDQGGIQSEFYVSYRKNCCVVCGHDANYMRFHVVPILYRQFFPESLKSHRSHDVVLLCFPCVEKSNALYDKQKKLIADRYNVPLFIPSPQGQDSKNFDEMKKNVKTLLTNFEEMPKERKIIFCKNIIDFLQTNKDDPLWENLFNSVFILKGRDVPNDDNDLNRDILKDLKNFNKSLINFSQGNKKNHHGKFIVEKVEDFTEFIKEWRLFFIEALNPKYLPDSWNVEHEFFRTFGTYSKFNKK